jgi:signal peptidase II
MNAALAAESPAMIGAVERVPLNRYFVFFAIALTGICVDLLTKAWVFAKPALRGGEIYWLWTGHVGFQLSRNRGALFGMGQGNVWLFATLGLLAALAIPTWLFVFRAARDLWLTIALGSVMAGVIGNLYDRLGMSGEEWAGPGQGSPLALHAVRDWILWQWNDQWRWPNFNVADSMLVVGACLLFLMAMRNPQASKKTTG